MTKRLLRKIRPLSDFLPSEICLNIFFLNVGGKKYNEPSEQFEPKMTGICHSDFIVTIFLNILFYKVYLVVHFWVFDLIKYYDSF